MTAKITTGLRRGDKARSGPSSPEWRLTNKVVAVRLPPKARVALEALMAQWGLSRSATIARLVMEATGDQPTKGGEPSP